MTPDATFCAVVAERHENGVACELRSLTQDQLGDGQVTVRVAYSSVNHKDRLAVAPAGRVARISPLVPGIDLAGEVIASQDPEVAVGSLVAAHGYALGVARHGGYAQIARMPADWVIPLREGLDPRSAMAIGTAGYTAALSVEAIQGHGIGPEDGPVLVLGTGGGVGSTAVEMLANLGYEVWASTGSDSAHDPLRRLGAHAVVRRDETSAPSEKPLESERWSAVIDPVGGDSLAYALRTLRYGGAVASSGNVGGAGLTTSVFPFILRGVALRGIDSVETPIDKRRAIWRRLAGDLRPVQSIASAHEVTLAELPTYLCAPKPPGSPGRTIVRIHDFEASGP